MSKQRTLLIITAALLSITLLCCPPLILESLIVGNAFAEEYNGICPGIMDIPAYPCTPLEFLERTLFSPFALPIHVILIVATLACTLPLVAILWLGLVFFLRRQRTYSV